MEYIVINGQKPLSGKVQIGGAKNAAVSIVPAAVAANGVCIIENLPDIKDVRNLAAAIEKLGAKCRFLDNGKTLEVDAGCIKTHIADYELAAKMRASYYLLGALLGRFGKAEVPMPGGCDFGYRPIDYHIKGFEALGAKCVMEHGWVKITAEKLTGANIYLDGPSVGATINIMLAAVFAEGTTQIENSAREPYVVDTANFLNMMGAKISGAGTDIIRINGVKELGGGRYTIIPDPIETGTYMVAAAITNGDITVENIIPKHMDPLTAKLRDMNCQVEEGEDSLRVYRNGELKACDVKTSYYPGFPTDLQPQMATLLCTASGASVVTETVFNNRFQYINELKRLGANFKVDGRTAVTKGSCTFTGAQVAATDLRSGAALVLAGLAAKGETTIGNIFHLDRGYENLEDKLRALGADIKRIPADE
ncbi:MAG: UDP-N-acetylglucosamine 1-carboxyvinyltransferase [Defluviitaleaceae bacterium]|nr:UDP-N-acetylglucosamine 1-carboxyvinyltransferase [Defluviitaleaceae bacterium]